MGTANELDETSLYNCSKHLFKEEIDNTQQIREAQKDKFEDDWNESQLQFLKTC